MTPAAFTDENGTLRFTGAMTLAGIGDLPKRLEGVGQPRAVDLSGVERIDTVGAWLVHRLTREGGARVDGASEQAQHLLEQVGQLDAPLKSRPDERGGFTAILDHMGCAVTEAGRTLHGLVGFLGGILISAWALATNPGRMRWRALSRQIEVVGVDALAIVGLMSFLIGFVIAQQGAIQLRQFGADVFTINLIGRITFRELGVLMTAIMVAGRSGSAFAAQIGSMRLAEEVDAMRTIGIGPIEALVIPRVAATVLMMPLLGFYAALCALVGGGLYCWVSLDLPPVTFLGRIREVVPITDVLTGLIKAPVFGLIIAMAGCYQGMLVEGNAEEVGLKTTSAVVQSIFLVIIVNAMFAVFFASIGWV